MTFRDPLEAAFARIAALEEELGRVRAGKASRHVLAEGLAETARARLDEMRVAPCWPSTARTSTLAIPGATPF